MDPRRPTSEQAARAELRVRVGNSSVVKTYIELKANVIANFPKKNSPRPVPL